MFNNKVCDYVKKIIFELMNVDEKQILENNPNFGKEFLEPSLSVYLYEFVNYYKNEAKKIIDKVKNEKAIDYLNVQAINEKSRHMNVDVINKCNKAEFIEIITDVLQNNFYYTAQKYYIYKFLNMYYDYSQIVENQFNNMAKNIIPENKYNHIYELIYKEKIENLKERIDEFCEREGWA